jgi:hypothetical protein
MRTSLQFIEREAKSLATMVMKPGARPHCGMKAVRAPGQLLHRARAGDIFGQIQVVSAGALGRLGDERVA